MTDPDYIPISDQDYRDIKAALAGDPFDRDEVAHLMLQALNRDPASIDDPDYFKRDEWRRLAQMEDTSDSLGAHQVLQMLETIRRPVGAAAPDA